MWPVLLVCLPTSAPYVLPLSVATSAPISTYLLLALPIYISPRPIDKIFNYTSSQVRGSTWLGTISLTYIARISLFAPTRSSSTNQIHFSSVMALFFKFHSLALLLSIKSCAHIIHRSPRNWVALFKIVRWSRDLQWDNNGMSANYVKDVSTKHVVDTRPGLVKMLQQRSLSNWTSRQQIKCSMFHG